MNKEDKQLMKKLMKEAFNYNIEVNNHIRLNTLGYISYVSTLIFITLIFCANNIIGKTLSLMFAIAFTFGFVYSLIKMYKKNKELIKWRKRLRKIFK